MDRVTLGLSLATAALVLYTHFSGQHAVLPAEESKKQEAPVSEVPKEKAMAESSVNISHQVNPSLTGEMNMNDQMCRS